MRDSTCGAGPRLVCGTAPFALGRANRKHSAIDPNRGRNAKRMRTPRVKRKRQHLEVPRKNAEYKLPLLASVQKEFQVAFTAGETAGLDGQAAKSAGRERRLNGLNRFLMQSGVGDDAAPADVFATQLELRFDEYQEVGIGRGATYGGGQHLGDRDKREVGDHQAGKFRHVGWLQFAGVAFDPNDAGVLLQFPVQLVDIDVHREDASSSVLQQAVGEASVR